MLNKIGHQSDDWPLDPGNMYKHDLFSTYVLTYFNVKLSVSVFVEMLNLTNNNDNNNKKDKIIIIGLNFYKTVLSNVKANKKYDNSCVHYFEIYQENVLQQII